MNMKKMRFLSLGALALLTLTACSSEGGEISKKEALAMYKDKESKAAGYVGAAEYGEFNYKVVNKKSDEAVTEIQKYFTTNVLPYMTHFVVATPVPLAKDCFIKNDVEETITLAKYFGEAVTYTKNEKKVTTHFTGSVNSKDEKYSTAMYFEAKYNDVGLLYSSKFNFVLAGDANEKGEVLTKVKGDCSLKITWSKAA